MFKKILCLSTLLFAFSFLVSCQSIHKRHGSCSSHSCPLEKQKKKCTKDNCPLKKQGKKCTKDNCPLKKQGKKCTKDNCPLKRQGKKCTKDNCPLKRQGKKCTKDNCPLKKGTHYKKRCSKKRGSWFSSKKNCPYLSELAGRAYMNPISSNTKGWIYLEPTSQKKIKVTAQIKGLKPNQKFGFHIHEFGDCSQKALKAGGHFNPWKKKHGGLKSHHRHFGDLGNLSSDDKGMAQATITIPGHLKMLLGRSVIIHDKEDDLKSQSSSGNSGARISCGIIGTAFKESPAKNL